MIAPPYAAPGPRPARLSTSRSGSNVSSLSCPPASSALRPSPSTKRSATGWASSGNTSGWIATALVQLSAHSPRLHVTQVNDGGRAPDSPTTTASRSSVRAWRRSARETSSGCGGSRTWGVPARPTGQRSRPRRVGALLATPLSVGGQPLGFMALMTERAREWSDEEVSRLQLVAGMVASALLRQELRPLPPEQRRPQRCGAGLALGEGGRARPHRQDRSSATRRGRGLRRSSAAARPTSAINYLDACRAAVGHDPAAADVVRGIEGVLAGDGVRGFRTEYGSPPGNGWRWDELVIEPLRVPQGGAVVMLTDATARKRAELEAEAHRAEAAHAARGATLGELAAGLAHELNQPLAAILTNVQASQRLLASEPLRLELLRDIMKDIAADDVRAAEIIRRMRALLKKGQRDVQPLDLSQLAGDVLRLVASDAILRRVRIHPQLEPDLPGIVGDRVELQQVILNLVVNGLESMSADRTRAPPPDHPHRAAGHRLDRGHGAGHRSGHLGRDPGPDLRALLLDQARRSGHGALHLPLHRGSAQWEAGGFEQSGRGRDLQLRPPGGRNTE